jgi:hypothetical protein
MTLLAKPQSLVGALPAMAELSAVALFEAFEAQKEKPLVFNYEGHDVRPSYHVTEVKTGAFRGLDCGANTESWNETFIQLWDIEEENRGHMPGWKFLAIIGKVRDAVGFDDDAKPTFEVSDGQSPMRIYRAEHVEVGDVLEGVSFSASVELQTARSLATARQVGGIVMLCTKTRAKVLRLSIRHDALLGQHPLSKVKRTARNRLATLRYSFST